MREFLAVSVTQRGRRQWQNTERNLLLPKTSVKICLCATSSDYQSGYPATMCDTEPRNRNQNNPVCPRCHQEDPNCLTEETYLSEEKKHRCDMRSPEDWTQKKPEPPLRGKDPDTNSCQEQCRFSSLGCRYRGSRQQVKAHEESAVGTHLSLVVPLLSQFRDSVSWSEGREYGHPEVTRSGRRRRSSRLQNGEVMGVMAADSGCQEVSPEAELLARVAVLEARSQVFENIISVLSREMDGANAKMATALERRSEEQQRVKAFEQQVSSLRCMVAQKEAALSELQVRLVSLEQTSYDGGFLWKISDFAKKRQDAVIGRAVSLYSPAFYTARYGYKVCLRTYLNGDGAGRGTHLSLFFTIMKGEYDALLPWPFTHKVTFILLDHSSREHAIDAFRPDVVSASFQRPISSMNIASGCPLFCPLFRLQDAHNNYVKEDTIFIRCIIDTSSQ